MNNNKPSKIPQLDVFINMIEDLGLNELENIRNAIQEDINNNLHLDEYLNQRIGLLNLLLRNAPKQSSRKTLTKGGNIHYFVIGGKINSGVLKNVIKNGYAKNPKDNKNINGYILDNELSGKRAQVYHNPKTNHTLVNHRGTQGIHDLYTDVKLMFGYKNNNRFKHGKKITDDALKKYSDSNVSVIGHSLGSEIAREANKEHNKESILLNPAITPSDMFKKQKNNEIIIKSKIDPISVLHNFNPNKSDKNTIEIKNKTYNPLKEHSSNILNRLNDVELGME
jgi:hypothetical protein